MNRRAMKTRLIAIIFCVLSVSAVYGQTYAYGLNRCAREYYDPNNSNWLSYKDICNQAIHITLVGISKTFTSDMDVEPGRHGGPKLSANEVKSYGGLTMYVCPAGFFAVDAAERPIRLKIVNRFTCKKWGF
jgi:hypothetical protein